MRYTGGAVVRISLLAAALVTALTLAACSRNQPSMKFQATDVTAVDWGRDFHLLDAAGSTRSLQDYRAARWSCCSSAIPIVPTCARPH